MTTFLKFHFCRKSYVFTFRWDFFLLCLILFGLCCSLGVWQLHRYAYKKTLLVSYQQRLSEVPLPFATALQQSDLQFRQVKVQGYYLNELTLLVQNRFYHDVLGFEVLTPFAIQGEKKLLLVDRGWVEKNKIDAVSQIKQTKPQNMTGYLKSLDEYQFILGENILQPAKKPWVIQRVDMQDISRVTQQLFYPFILRLNPHAPNGYVRDWAIVSMLPKQHLAYALQWFALALVLFIAYICFCLTKEGEHAKKQ